MAVPMDGKGRALDNIFTERLWRTVKYEEVYPRSYGTPHEARQSLARYVQSTLQPRARASGARLPYARRGVLRELSATTAQDQIKEGEALEFCVLAPDSVS